MPTTCTKATIIKAVKARLAEVYPKYYKSVEPYLKDFEENSGAFSYSLLEGLVQQGKTIAVIIIIWVLNIEHGVVTPFITKNLSTVRTDILSKFRNGFLNPLVKQVCLDHDVPSKKYTIKAVAGHKKSGISPGTVPIFLMNPTNHRSVISFFEQVKSTLSGRGKCVFVVDEVHELYTDFRGFVAAKGFTKTEKDTFSNRHLLHALWGLCREHGFSSILGITATPYRTMTSDPECIINHHYLLDADPPCKGLDYFGYSRTKQCLENIQVHTSDDDDVCATMRDILSQPVSTLQNGAKEIRFVYISTHAQSADQVEMLEDLQDEFGDQIYCQLLIGRDTQVKWGIPREYVAPSLASFFSESNLTDEICTSGAFVLIAQKTLAASVTVKPELGQTCGRKVDGQDYQIVGITDQITKSAGNLEAQMQRSRLFGWFPTGHSSRFWVTKASIRDFQSGFIQTSSQFTENYDPKVGPESVANIAVTTRIKSICASSCPYRVGKRFGVSRVTTDIRPQRGRSLKTKTYPLTSLEADWSGLTLADLSSAEKSKLRKAILKATKQDSTRFHMPWKQKKIPGARYNQILESCVRPNTEKGANWCINKYVTCENGEPWSVPIHELVLVTFTVCCEDRPHWAVQGNCKQCEDNETCDEHVDFSTKIWFHDGFHYQSFSIGKMMSHSKIEQFRTWNYNRTHYQILNSLGVATPRIVAKMKKFIRAKSLKPVVLKPVTKPLRLVLKRKPSPVLKAITPIH